MPRLPRRRHVMRAHVELHLGDELVHLGLGQAEIAQLGADLAKVDDGRRSAQHVRLHAPGAGLFQDRG